MNQLLKLLDLVKALAECYRVANEDGKITWIDIYKFEPAMDELAAFVVSTTEMASFATLDPRKIPEIGKKLDQIAKIMKG